MGWLIQVIIFEEFLLCEVVYIVLYEIFEFEFFCYIVVFVFVGFFGCFWL